jgi:hypothetical protein
MNYYTTNNVVQRAGVARQCFDEYLLQKTREGVYQNMEIECISEQDQVDEDFLRLFEHDIRKGNYTIITSNCVLGRIVVFGGKPQYALDVACYIKGVPCVITLLETMSPRFVPSPDDFIVMCVLYTQQIGVYPPIVGSV